MQKIDTAVPVHNTWGPYHDPLLRLSNFRFQVHVFVHRYTEE